MYFEKINFIFHFYLKDSFTTMWGDVITWLKKVFKFCFFLLPPLIKIFHGMIFICDLCIEESLTITSFLPYICQFMENSLLKSWKLGTSCSNTSSMMWHTMTTITWCPHICYTFGCIVSYYPICCSRKCWLASILFLTIQYVHVWTKVICLEPGVGFTNLYVNFMKIEQ